jgi:hypothetical protein
MADKQRSEHDLKTSASAESLRGIINDPAFRGGATERDIQAIKDKLEAAAKQLDDQGKDPKELEKERAESNEPDPNKTAAELVRDAFNSEDPKNKDKNITSPGVPGRPVDNKVDLGKPAVTSQASTHDRDKVEAAAKKADDTIKDASKK